MKQKIGKKLYSLGEAYGILYHAFSTFPIFKKAKKTGTLDARLKEKIMLAVTEVNGCAMCSYAHSQYALETGMSNEEIQAILGGNIADVAQEELGAILFAQHYADSRGKPTKTAWEQIVKQYGEAKSFVILSAIQLIMAGNTYGIPLGSFRGRLMSNKKSQIDARSSLIYELSMLLSFIVFVPMTFIQSIIAHIFHRPLIKFQ